MRQRHLYIHIYDNEYNLYNFTFIYFLNWIYFNEPHLGVDTDDSYDECCVYSTVPRLVSADYSRSDRGALILMMMMLMGVMWLRKVMLTTAGEVFLLMIARWWLAILCDILILLLLRAVMVVMMMVMVQQQQNKTPHPPDL